MSDLAAVAAELMCFSKWTDKETRFNFIEYKGFAMQ